MKQVIYNDSSDKRDYLVLVPDDTDEKDYGTGIVLGPPELEELGLERSTITALHNALVKDQFIFSSDLLGRRLQLRQLINKLVSDDVDHMAIERHIIHIYQREEFGV